MENLYKRIVETIPVFFFVWDVDKKETVFINEKFYDHRHDRYYAPDTPRENLRQYVAEESQADYDTFFAKLSNNSNSNNFIKLKANNLPQIRWIKISTFPIDEQDNQTHYITGHISDVTYEHEHGQILEEQVDNIDTIIFMLAHELSSPITNIMGLAEYFRQRAEKGENPQPTYLYDTIYNRGGEVLTLARGMVSLLNLQFDKEEFTREDIQLKPFIEELIDNFYHRSNVTNATISVAHIDESIRVPMQAEKFGKAIEELLVYLIKRAESNQTISLFTSDTDQPDQIQLCVVTTATNLPQSAIQNVLNRSSKLTLSDVKGRGVRGMLELVIAKEIVELHQGKLKLLNEHEAQGFLIKLPAHPPSSSDRNAQ